MTLYKVTAPDGMPINGGTGRWPLPKRDRLGRLHRGKWRRVRGPVIACQNGLHLVEHDHVSGWVPGGALFTIWEAEGRGSVDEKVDKLAFERARLIRPVFELQPEDFDAYRIQSPRRTIDGLIEFAARRERERRVDALTNRPLIFGVHRLLDIRDREAPAWPNRATFDRQRRYRTDRRARRLLGWTARLERLIKLDPTLARELIA